MKKLNVVILGSGAREHALAWKISQSPLLNNLFLAPGNGGTKIYGNLPQEYCKDQSAIGLFCSVNNIDLVVVGPENLLADGISDYLTSMGINVFGPSKMGALIETDKAYASTLCSAAGIPTPATSIFDSMNSLRSYLNSAATPIVIKDSSLAAGKGVLITDNSDEAETFANKIFAKNSKVVIQEYLEGSEISAFCLCDGKIMKYLGDAQDYKRLCDNDEGPNTGGMGSTSPAASYILQQEIMDNFAKPLLSYMLANKITYRGVIFFGLIITSKGLKLLEFNARFGDPETQSLMPRIDCDFLQLLYATATETLQPGAVTMRSCNTACVVMAAKGYPGEYPNYTSLRITNPYDGTLILHAGTEEGRGDSQMFIATGGRTLSIVAESDLSKEDAASRAYSAIKRNVVWEHGYYRKDIGTKK